MKKNIAYLGFALGMMSSTSNKSYEQEMTDNSSDTFPKDNEKCHKRPAKDYNRPFKQVIPKGCKLFNCSVTLENGELVEKEIIAISSKSASKKFKKYLETLNK